MRIISAQDARKNYKNNYIDGKKRDIMNDINVMCHYHLNKMSKFSCEICNHPICEECYEIEKTEEKKGKQKEIIRHYYCKPCYYDNEISKIKASPQNRLRSILKFILLPIIILITLFFIFFGIDLFLFIPIDFFIWKLWMAFLLVMLEIGFIFSLIRAKLNTPKTIKHINVEKARFLSNINTLKKRYNEMQEDLSYKCPYCHAQIEKNSSICRVCGMDLEKPI